TSKTRQREMIGGEDEAGVPDAVCLVSAFISTFKLAPLPVPPLKAVSVPPCISISDLEIESPSPSPPILRDSSLCSKASNNRSSICRAMHHAISLLSHS